MKTDDEIGKDVIEEIHSDPQLTSVAPQIGVSVKNEVVTLTGEVDYFAQRLAAENAAQRVSGVKVVAVDIEVKGTADPTLPRSDSEIGAAIRNALTWHSAVNEELIDIKVDNGWVYLTGTLNWDYERKAAERAIENIIGIKGIINTIKIKTKNASPQDIKKRIAAAFHRSATIDSSNVAVTVKDNRVTLRGNVRSWAERKDAEDVAWSIAGITEVDNGLEIISEVYVGE